jgi:hypothetical protein
MRAVFCPDLFQEFFSLKYDGLCILDYHTQKNCVKNSFTISYQVSNNLAQQFGLETVMFIYSDESSRKIYGPVETDCTVIIPEKYNNVFPRISEKTFAKMLAFASTKEPFIFLSCTSLIKNSIFVDKIKSSNRDVIFSYTKCIPNFSYNKKLINFWSSILPSEINFQDMPEIKSYDLSFFAAKNYTLVNEVARDLCDILIKNKNFIEEVYRIQFKNSSGDVFNPDICYLVECILFPYLIMSRLKNTPGFLCEENDSKKIYQTIRSDLDVFSETNSHIISSNLISKEIYENYGLAMYNLITYEAWIEIFYNYYIENNLDKIIV